MFVRDCSDSSVVAACGQFRTRDCRGITAFLCCDTQPIIEATCSIKFSCFQYFYSKLEGQFKRQIIPSIICVQLTHSAMSEVSEIFYSFLLESKYRPGLSMTKWEHFRKYGTRQFTQSRRVAGLMRIPASDFTNKLVPIAQLGHLQC